MPEFAALAKQMALQVINFIDLPAIVLMFLLGAALWMCRAAQHRDDFDWASALKDRDGDKVSVYSVAALGAFALSSWVMMKTTMVNHSELPTIFLFYVLIWSGAPAAVVIAEKWNGSLPWAK